MRRILDAKDYKTNEPVYLKGHAKATYTSNGMSVEDSMGNKSDKIAVVSHGTNDTTFVLTPNVMHRWGTVGSLTLTLGQVSDESVYNEYMFEFVSGDTATNLSLPETVSWVSEPSIEPGYTYQCSIVNNVGIIVGVEKA